MGRPVKRERDMAAYGRAKLAQLLDLDGLRCTRAFKRGLEIAGEVQHGSPKDARERLAGRSREELEDMLLTLAAVVETELTQAELLYRVTQTMAYPQQRCAHCNTWFSGLAQRKYCSEKCSSAERHLKAKTRSAA